MKREKQRLVIAEVCGFHHCHVSLINRQAHFNWAHRDDDGWKEWARNDQQSNACPTHDLPDFLHDLNAMHEAEKIFMENQLGPRYQAELDDINSRNLDYGVYHSSASERAEAFLRTLGKWETSA